MEISIKMPGGKETITHRSMCIVCVEEEIFIFYDPFFDGQARMEAIGDIRWGSRRRLPAAIRRMVATCGPPTAYRQGPGLGLDEADWKGVRAPDSVTFVDQCSAVR